ncbi:hypothetical protein C2845_PM04G13790 [Panicum miliaceum]|uniref:Uncharacterized protein n=1 Tax=Panicum miliaceum TaxID=4540 RepID=A0A3L6QRC7_PANMI|nr:hypothetical protein C2845_PM04G13790 [Panicum miliaceum]
MPIPSTVPNVSPRRVKIHRQTNTSDQLPPPTRPPPTYKAPPPFAPARRTGGSLAPPPLALVAFLPSLAVARVGLRKPEGWRGRRRWGESAVDRAGQRGEPMAYLHVSASAARIQPGRRRIRPSCSQAALLSLGLAARCGVLTASAAAARRRARGGVGRVVRRRRPLRGLHGGTCAAEAVRARIGRGGGYVATAKVQGCLVVLRERRAVLGWCSDGCGAEVAACEELGSGRLAQRRWRSAAWWLWPGSA